MESPRKIRIMKGGRKETEGGKEGLREGEGGKGERDERRGD